MDQTWLQLLGQGDEKSPIPALIFFLIFGFISLINWLQKRNRERRQQTSAPRVPPPIPTAPSPPHRQDAPYRPQPKPKVRRPTVRAPMRPQQRPVPQRPAQQRAPVVPPPPVGPAVAEPPSHYDQVEFVHSGGEASARAMAAEISDARPKSQGHAAVSATQLRGLLSRGNVRGNYVITELLQPPVSMREHHS